MSDDEDQAHYTLEDVAAGRRVPPGVPLTPLTPGGGVVAGIPGTVKCHECGVCMSRAHAGQPAAVIAIGPDAFIEAFFCATHAHLATTPEFLMAVERMKATVKDARRLRQVGDSPRRRRGGGGDK